MYGTRLKETNDLQDLMQNTQHHFDKLQRSFVVSEIDRKTTFELLESKDKDELTIMATSVEVKITDTMNTPQFSFV